MSSNLMGIREYARHRKEKGLPGATHQAVTKAITAGRISTIKTGDNSRPKIDPAVADIQWMNNTDPDQSARANAGKEHGSPPGSLAENGNRYWDAKTERELVELDRARLALAKDSGQLVDKEGVRRAGFDIGRQLRDLIMAIPSRLAAELAALDDARAIEARMSEELRKTLTQISRLALSGFKEEGEAGTA